MVLSCLCLKITKGRNIGRSQMSTYIDQTLSVIVYFLMAHFKKNMDNLYHFPTMATRIVTTQNPVIEVF